MAETVTRRYRRQMAEGRELPGLVLIDGGLGQLHATQAVLAELGLDGLDLASLAKKEELVFRPHRAEPLRIPRSSPVLQLLQRIRDEAHRFAITAHRSQRGKIGLASRLDAVVGVGPARRKELINRFGSIEGILAASVEEISQIKGISAEMAQAIKAQLE